MGNIYVPREVELKLYENFPKDASPGDILSHLFQIYLDLKKISSQCLIPEEIEKILNRPYKIRENKPNYVAQK